MLRIVKRLIRIAGPNGKRLKLSFVISFLYSILESLPTCALFAMFNGLCSPKGITRQLLFFCTGLLVFAVLAKWLVRYIVQVLQVGTGFYIFCDQRLEIGDTLKRVPMGYYSEKNIGEITSAVTTDSSFVENYSMFYLDKLINGFLNTAMISVFLFFFEWRIGLLSLAVLGISVTVYFHLQLIGKHVTPDRQRAQAGLVTAALEYIHGMAVAKSYGLAGESLKDFYAKIEESRRQNFRLEVKFSPFVDLFQFVFHFGVCLIVFISGYLLLGETITMAKALLLIVAAFIVYLPAEGLGAVIPMIRLMEASLDRIDAVKDVPAMLEGNLVQELEHHDIEFRHVTFAYDQKEVIRDVSFVIPSHTMTAIVGPSGSGKTTLCNLIARFWDVQQGEVRIGGQRVTDMLAQVLLSNLSMVFQNVYLFNDTIYNNICFGNPKATREEVMEAAKKACCHDFIIQLEQGYETMVGEGGASLSGGEKQRISIARAILKDAPIIMLDEATASIDPENEVLIQKAIHSLVKDKTVIMIAHRLQTVVKADQILVLEAGKLVQQGTHAQLSEQNGVYKRFLEARREASLWQI